MHRIVIIGGGASAAVSLRNISRQLNENPGASEVAVTIVSDRKELGLGVAYSAPSARHVLNVPAGKISAIHDEPDHFLNWARIEKNSKEFGITEVGEGDFLPRQMYGKYLQEVATEGLSESGIKLSQVNARATQVTRASGFEVECSDGQVLKADKLVLAMGNQQPGLPAFGPQGGHPGFITDPWSSQNDWAGLNDEDPVLIIGTGLTMVDIHSLLREKGYKGQIHAVSRHGLLPKQHEKHPPYPLAEQLIEDISPAKILRKMRLASQETGNWRGVLDSLRPHTQKIWHGFTDSQKAVFKKKLRTYWDVHRHRMAKSVGDFLKQDMEQGGCHIHSGRVDRIEPDPASQQLKVYLQSHGAEGSPPESMKFSTVINCTGPNPNWSRDSLMASLLKMGAVRPGPGGIGVDCNEHGVLLDDKGEEQRDIAAIGPMIQGTLFETTAIPEIRVQAARVASICLSSILSN